MKSGKCSLYVNWLIKTAYKDESSFTGIACFPNHAWGVAACNLRNAQISPETSRVVYAGPGLSFDQLFLDGRLLKQGDILFTSTKQAGVNGVVIIFIIMIICVAMIKDN